MMMKPIIFVLLGAIISVRAVRQIYTRWGRSVCPETANLVYEGFAGGSTSLQRGGGSNVICLPREPLWGKYSDDSEDGAFIFGAEYQMKEYENMGKTGMFSDENAKSLHNYDVFCAVCQTKNPSTVMMLPARNRCYPGWTLEYHGYLMTSDHKGRADYLCVDNDPEADPKDSWDHDGVNLHPVQSACRTCGDYVIDRELTCAVCSNTAGLTVHPKIFLQICILSISFLNAVKSYL